MILATPIHSRRPARFRASAFSLIELMLAVTITTVIVGALYAVFNQTQRALLANTNQVDVLENGRSAMDTIARELSFAAPALRPFVTNLNITRPPVYRPVVQSIPTVNEKSPIQRTNLLEVFYFLSRYRTNWVGTEYFVSGANNGVGALMRRTYEIHERMLNATNPMVAALDPRLTNTLARLADGVIHFQVKPFDSRGVPIAWYYMSPTNFYPNVAWQRDPLVPTATRLAFVSNALPAYLEVELGILEPQTLAQFRSFPPNPDGSTSAVAQKFLSTHTGQVQLFRQRVPVRLGVSLPVSQP